MRARPRRRFAAPALLLLVAATPADAIETDQFYAWGRGPADSTEAVNARVNLEIRAVLAELNAGDDTVETTCKDVRRRIARRFRLFLIHRLELWALNSALVDRVPADPEETFRFRDENLFGSRGALDPARLVPPSPTIRLDGVLVGTDKLTHFTSEGWWYFKWFERARRRGATVEEAERRAIRRGIFTERTILGRLTSGVFSGADLEANYQGMRFFERLCDGEPPMLAFTDDGWRLARPFDFRDHVSPEWDESWQPSIFNRRRWRRIRPVLLRYCSLLGNAEVRALRRTYAERDTTTETERLVGDLVDAGKLPDPRAYAIDTVCAEAD